MPEAGEGSAAARAPAQELLAGEADWIAALKAVGAHGHARLALLDSDACMALLESCEGLSYRLARPLVGASGREVRQDFDLTMEIPAPHPIRTLAASLSAAVSAAASRLAPNPLPQGIDFNDLIVQRYPRGSLGITPHRDHLRYDGLVILITLAGAARFFVCEDRAGNGAVEIPAPPGGAILLTAPGFAGGKARPFHFLDRVSQPRVSLGIRHDTRPGEPT
ncbi:MAG: hypothetical protein Kilf2KO_25610 [Rhodospirillales bacterium]